MAGLSNAEILSVTIAEQLLGFSNFRISAFPLLRRRVEAQGAVAEVEQPFLRVAASNRQDSLVLTIFSCIPA